MPDITSESPLASLKAVMLAYLRDGCPESDVEPQFPVEEGELAWQYITGDEFEEVALPCFQVILDGDPVPLSAARPGWVHVPIKVIVWAPLSAEEEWLQAVESRLWDLLNGVWHERERANQAENTPLAVRLTDVAAAMDPAVPFLAAFADMAHPQRFTVVGEAAQIQVQLSVCCGMYEV